MDSHLDGLNYRAFAAEFVETLGNNPPADPFIGPPRNVEA
jgi:hypothetical protein